MLDEGIVLLGSTFCQWLEPVSVVGYAILVSPLLDAFGYGVGDVTVETCSVVDDIYQFLMSYLFLAKNCCMSARHSSSSTPDVTIVLGCSAWGAYLV